MEYALSGTSLSLSRQSIVPAQNNLDPKSPSEKVTEQVNKPSNANVPMNAKHFPFFLTVYLQKDLLNLSLQ